MRPEVMVRVVQPHVETEDGYHEWVTLGERLRANRLMVSNPRMYLPTATKWICNGPDCPAWALVSDAFLQRILAALEMDLHPAGATASPPQGVETLIGRALTKIDAVEGTEGGTPARGELPRSAAPDAVPGRLGR